MESIRSCFVVYLMTWMIHGVVGVPSSHADEATIAAAQGDNSSFDPDANRGRIIWAMLDEIERQHIFSPSRRELVQTFARLFKQGDAVSDVELELEFLRCQSADQLNDFVNRNPNALISFRQMIEKLNERSSIELGNIQLIRAKDHEVEEQFRGNRYVGIGVSIRTIPVKSDRQFPLPQFAMIAPGGPAERGGLQAGTVIHEIDGHSTEIESLETTIDRLRGPQGTDVTLKVSAEGSTEMQTVTLTRGVVRFDSLINKSHESLNRGSLRCNQEEPIGWINVSNITGSTLHELRQAELKAKTEGIRVLILDFQRSRRSDDIHQALMVADGLLSGGPIWRQVERSSAAKLEHADRDCLFRDLPLIVLVSRSTGFAHCAIAAALQDAGRAKILGESPDFRGLCPSFVPLVDVPFSLLMNTSKLTRSHSDRDWPLQPDVTVGDAGGQQESISTANKPTLINQNLSTVYIDLNTKEKDLTRVVAPTKVYVQNKSDSTPQSANQASVTSTQPAKLGQRETIDDMGLRIARQALTALRTAGK